LTKFTRKRFLKAQQRPKPADEGRGEMREMLPNPAILPEEAALVRIGAQATGKEDAIRQVGQMLVAAGCVAPGYENSMVRREAWPTPIWVRAWRSPMALARTRGWCAATAWCCNARRHRMEPRPDRASGGGHRRHSDSHITILRRLTRLIQDEARG
jgi:phosphocarrier protein FPr